MQPGVSTDISLCGHCGYDIHGLPSSICPECGKNLWDVGIRRRPRSSVVPLWLPCMIWGVACFVLCKTVGRNLTNTYGWTERTINASQRLVYEIERQRNRDGTLPLRETFSIYITTSAKDQTRTPDMTTAPLTKYVTLTLAEKSPVALTLNSASVTTELRDSSVASPPINLPRDETALATLHTLAFPGRPFSPHAKELFKEAWQAVEGDLMPIGDIRRWVDSRRARQTTSQLLQISSGSSDMTNSGYERSWLNRPLADVAGAVLWLLGLPLIRRAHRKWVDRATLHFPLRP